MRVAIADDMLIARAGIVAILRGAGIVVTAEARDGVELLAKIEDDPPDVALLDIRMPPTHTDEGLQVAAKVRARFPGVGVLLLSTYSDPEYASALLRMGRDGVGYLLKDKIQDVDSFAESIQRVADGECVIDPDIIARLLTRETARALLGSMSPREQDVLRLMAEGRSNAGMCRQLHLQPTTVEKHVAAVFTALQLTRQPEVNRRVAAVLLWLQVAAREGS